MSVTGNERRLQDGIFLILNLYTFMQLLFGQRAHYDNPLTLQQFTDLVSVRLLTLSRPSHHLHYI